MGWEGVTGKKLPEVSLTRGVGDRKDGLPGITAHARENLSRDGSGGPLCSHPGKPGPGPDGPGPGGHGAAGQRAQRGRRQTGPGVPWQRPPGRGDVSCCILSRSQPLLPAVPGCVISHRHPQSQTAVWRGEPAGVYSAGAEVRELAGAQGLKGEAGPPSMGAWPAFACDLRGARRGEQTAAKGRHGRLTDRQTTVPVPGLRAAGPQFPHLRTNRYGLPEDPVWGPRVGTPQGSLPGSFRTVPLNSQPRLSTGPANSDAVSVQTPR